MQRYEIGSEFHLCSGLQDAAQAYSIFDYLTAYNALYFDSGRSALRFLLKGIPCKKVLLPGYICQSVRDCFAPDCQAIYYEVDQDLKINWSDLLEKCTDDVDVVYLHYFNGYIGAEYDLKALQDKKQEKGFVIVEDTTHSLFSAAYTAGDYCVCSLRKWFPIADGGVLYTKNSLTPEEFPENTWWVEKTGAMAAKDRYLRGMDECKQDFLDTFAHAEECLDQQTTPFAMSAASRERLKTVDCHDLAKTRQRNFQILKDRIPGAATASGGKGQVPLFFTMRAENRDQMRKYFAQHNIYCPVHWPLYEELRGYSGAVWNNKTELSIPIDQRYGEADMLYICDVYQRFMQRGED